jgi:DNA invertase Pin-like site-specific DNA recombinase
MTHKPRLPAISYTRFSNATQHDGDSQDRQDRRFRDFCQGHNLTPVKEVFADRGRSGYKDEHRKKGRLGQLIAMAKVPGRFETGTVIVVEAWDRLGRLRPDKQTELVAELLQTGVCIGVCALGDIFSEDDFGGPKWATLSMFIQLAYHESKQKAERLASAWQRRRERARCVAEAGAGDIRLLVGALPAWLEEDAKGRVVLVPDRVAAIRRIFRMAAGGLGVTRIVRALEKVPAFGQSGRWTRPYIGMLLGDRRVLGEVQPHKGGKPDGPPIAGAMPAAVTPEEYDLARAAIDARKSPHDNARQGKYVNLFRGLLVHARDGLGMMMDNKGTAAAPELVLLNASGRDGGKNYTFPYGVFEEAVLGKLTELTPEEVLPPLKGEAPSRADALRATRDAIQRDIRQLQEELEGGFSKAISDVLRRKEAALEAAAGELQEELARSARSAERTWRELPSLVEIARTDEGRLRLAAALRSIIDEAWLLIVPRGAWRLAALQVFFHGGAVRHYVLMHRPAANRRPAITPPPLSLSNVVREDKLDLRRKEDSAALERLLETIDLEALTG